MVTRRTEKSFQLTNIVARKLLEPISKPSTAPDNKGLKSLGGRFTDKFLVIWVSLALGLAACQPTPTPRVASRPLNVIATHSILGDWVSAVGGEAIHLSVLVPAGGDAHTFAPTAADSVALAEADLLFENGLGFETWLDDVYAASASQAKRIVVTDAIEPLAAAEEAGHADEQGAFDPHAWHSVANAIQMVKAIREALMQTDPANAALYQANAEVYLAQLQELDAWIFEQAKSLPADRRKLVTTHDTFGYFAARYGFEIVGTLLPTTTEGASPSAQAVAELVEAVRAAHIPAVFAENVSANSLLAQVANEAGVKVVATLYTDALGPIGSEGETYLKLMRFNVTTIVKALNS